ncbi:MAG: leucine-rich repeat protein [Bacteroidales bacterium]|nr:leucine-rich repeat protein [Candidatus Sodaliphilus fimicaballi]
MLKKTLLLIACAIMSWSAMLADEVTINGVNFRTYASGTAIVLGIEPGVKNMEIPNVIALNGKDYTVTDITSRCCENNTTLESLTIASSVKYIGSKCFNGCTNLKKVTIEDGVPLLPENCFLNCSSLEEIILPNSITEIGMYAFSKCTSLKKAVLPKSLKVIDQRVFADCTSLSQLVLPEELEEIKPDAFNKCAALTKVTFPTTLRTLGSTAFASSGLRTLYLPEGLEKMGDTFNGCKQLRLVSFPTTLDKIGTFYLCNGINEIECRRTTPPDLNSGVFMNELFTKTQVYVPKGSLAAYKYGAVWSRFTGIIDDYSPFPLTDTNGDKVTDVADVNRTIDSILKLNNQTHHRDDVNRDGIIDITDLNEIINEILGL